MPSDKHIRDPLYGYITVEGDEIEFIDSPEMQRLKRVKQLGLSDTVYPAATHTRFEHSLGVMHLAGKLSDSLGLSEEERKVARLSALLHDVGHGPFSHVSEKAVSDYDISHEDISCSIVDDLDLPVSSKRVKEHINGEGDLNIVAGTIDVDRLDYLRRDAYNTGIDHGNIDADTIIKFAEKHDDSIIFDGKAIQAIEGFLTSRNHMTKSVYRHHTSRIAEKMLQRAMQDFLQNGQMNPEDFMRLNDGELLHELKKTDGLPREMVEKIEKRNLYKRATILGTTYLTRNELRRLSGINEREFETKLCEKAGLSKGSILVDTPETPSSSASFDIKVRHYGTIKNISKISNISTVLDTEWRGVSFDIFSPEENISTARNVLKETLRQEVDVTW